MLNLGVLRHAQLGARKARLAGVAQLVEQLIRNQQVVGSSPTAGSKSPQKSSLVRHVRPHDEKNPGGPPNYISTPPPKLK